MFAISDQMLQCATAAPTPMLPIERKWKSNVELAPNCPRCASANTKFCYYNNYSLSQPRYFCKGCRRYWTKGGSLRNVPVGGGCRKSRRSKSSRVEKSGGGHLSLNYGKNLSSFGSRQEQTIGVSSSSDGDSENQPGLATSGSDIDLAVIFAQFLNQRTSLDQPAEIFTQESPGEGIDAWSFLEQETNSQNGSSTKCLEPAVVHAIPESYILQEMPQVKELQVKENNSDQELLETDQMNAYGLLETVQMDAFWSNDAAATTPNFEWQPLVQLQLQQLESFPIDNQLKVPANLMDENWSSFDLTGFELFSKP